MYVRAQNSNSLMAQYYTGAHSATKTKALETRTIFAEIAISAVRVWNRKTHHATAYISSMTSLPSSGGFQTFNEKKVGVWGVNVTQIQFHVAVYQSHCRARWMIHYYQT